MGKYDELTAARSVFGIGEEETTAEIKRKINVLLKRWHPDTGSDERGERKEKTTALLRAKKALMEYCDGYKISFSKSEVEKYLSPQERWASSFGDDHVWGGNK